MIKKILALFLATACLVNLFACSNNGRNDNNDITLTTKNFEQYVNLTCRATGAASTYKNGKYYGLNGYASCTGISGYYYDNVSVSITIFFDDGTNDAYPTIYLDLNVGGNASGSQYFTILNKSTKKLAYVSSTTISAYSSYSIESVRGTVRKA